MTVRLTGGVAAAVTLGALAAAFGGALAIVQVTKTTLCENFQPTISGDGKTIVFVSDCEVIPGRNTDHNYEVFRYDASTRTFQQVSDSAKPAANSQPSVNDDGAWVVFTSSGDLVPGANADRNPEVFLYDAAARKLTQVTRTRPPAANTAPSIDGAGRRVAFLSSADLVGGGNADGSVEAFLYDRPRNRIEQVTRLATGPRTPDRPAPPAISGALLSRDGTKLIIASSVDLTGEGDASGGEGWFLYDVASRAVRRVVSSVAGDAGHGHALPAASADASRLVFVASTHAGAAPAGAQPSHGGPSHRGGLFTLQGTDGALTLVLEAQDCDIQSPAIDGPGEVVAFSSNCDFTGQNQDRDLPNIELFVVRLSSGTVTQVTHTIRDFNHTPSIDRSGSRVVFGSDRDIHRGSNLDENSEIFLATLPTEP